MGLPNFDSYGNPLPEFVQIEIIESDDTETVKVKEKEQKAQSSIYAFLLEVDKAFKENKRVMYDTDTGIAQLIADQSTIPTRYITHKL
jgi:hypothetical protein